MTAVVIGGSAGLGRALAEAAAAEGHDLLLVSSDAADGEALAAHIRLTSGRGVTAVGADARDGAGFRETLAAALAPLERIDMLLLPIGAAFLDDTTELDEARRRTIWAVNYEAPLAAIELVLPKLGEGGRIAGFGSIASARGRSKNVHYAAAKSALRTYFESLRQTTAGSRVAVQFYIAGYIDTEQSYGRTVLFPAVAPASAARRVMADGARDFGARHLPFWWFGVTLAFRALPWFLFKRLGV
ncbi:MAG: SDR family oxidoreductase [Pseudomonadota bacterium]